MTLIKSISGIRGTIGGEPGMGFTPIDIVRYTTAYGMWLKRQTKKDKFIAVVGRDARISGELVKNIVVGTLQSLGIDVIHLGMATTPTTELAVRDHKADGGIIITASHNPKNWNALKLLNNKGEFLSASDGEQILNIATNEVFQYSEVDDLGNIYEDKHALQKHIDNILSLKLVDPEAIKKADFKIVVDGVNSIGGIAIPELLTALGVKQIHKIYCEPNGRFPHNPEPLPEHLSDISETIIKEKADIGFVVDPDADRLAIINEDGSMFGEEYTLVAIADYVLSNNPGNTVSNLSSSRALRDITEKHGGKYTAAAVGEVNVVEKMKETSAVIGGEGNGGVIYPDNHYGRDALVGVALFLTHLAKSGKKCSMLRKEYPLYYMSKNKIELSDEIDINNIFLRIKNHYSNEKITDIDGVKVDFEDKWLHLRKSNTEPIIRIYSEAKSLKEAEEAVTEFKKLIKNIP